MEILAEAFGVTSRCWWCLVWTVLSDTNDVEGNMWKGLSCIYEYDIMR